MSSSPPNNRSLEKLLQESEISGILNLSNRRLKEIGSLISKYDLTDVTQVNLTRNRLNEIPPECFEWHCIQALTLSYNSIKSISEFVNEFRILHTLVMSNNSLTVLPPQICELQKLTILRLNSNKLISLPEEIGKLKNCQELNVSANELTCIPPEISQMTSLVYLNIRKNRIFALPEELSMVPLAHLDAGCNFISAIPLSLRNMSTLVRLVLDNNPLNTPQMPVLRKGQVHLFRELEIQAEKMQIKREVLDDPLMSPLKKSSSNPDVKILEMKARALSISQEKDEAAQRYAEKAAELSKDRRKGSAPASPEKKVKSKKQEPKKTDKPSPKKQKSNENLAGLPPKKTPRLKEGNGPKSENQKERKRSASSGNFERKSSTEALLIHQKLSGFPGYKTHVNDKKSEVTNSNGSAQTNDKTNTKEKLQEFVKNRQALSPSERNNQAPAKKGFLPAAIKPRSAITRSRGSSFNDKELSFTMRRKTEKLYEELELMENLRQSIEARLKVSLGDDLPASLSNGVYLCQLTNHVRPRSVSSIHVPSPAVPKLTLAKRRRNIDNFLDACVKIGVPQIKVCSAQDILLEKNISKVASTVNELLRLCPNAAMSPKRQVEGPVVKVAPAVINKQHSAV